MVGFGIFSLIYLLSHKVILPSGQVGKPAEVMIKKKVTKCIKSENVKVYLWLGMFSVVYLPVELLHGRQV